MLPSQESVPQVLTLLDEDTSSEELSHLLGSLHSHLPFLQGILGSLAAQCNLKFLRAFSDLLLPMDLLTQSFKIDLQHFLVLSATLHLDMVLFDILPLDFKVLL